MKRGRPGLKTRTHALREQVSVLSDAYTELALFCQHTAAIPVTADADRPVSAFMDMLQRKTGAQAAFLYVWDEEVEALLPLRIEAPPALLPILRQFIRDLTEQLRQQQQFFQLTAADIAPPLAAQLAIQTLMVWPLHSAGQRVGAFGLLNAGSPVAAKQRQVFQLTATALLTTIRQQRWSQEIVRQHGEVITAKARLEQTLRHLERRQAMVESLSLEFAGDAITAVDMDGKITSWNKGAERVYGYSKEDVCGKTLDLLHPPAARHEAAQLLAGVVSGGVRSGIETIHRTRDGRDLVVSLTLSPVTDGTGQLVGVCIIGRDISQQKQLEETIRQQNECLEQTVQERTAELVLAKETAEAANQAKSAFLANISHELRTPLHGILSFARFGLKRAITAAPMKLHGYFQQIDQCGQTLLTLLNDLLDLAKLESGHMTFTCVPTELDTLIVRVADEYQALLSERRLTIFLLTGDSPLTLAVDPERIMQVLRNLLNNAIKFSPEGGTITLMLGREAEVVTVSVQDEGIGIPAPELGMIFDKFIQSSATKTGAGGTGLGLAICREIITRHGGRIWAANSPQKGAVFSFTLPLAPGISGA